MKIVILGAGAVGFQTAEQLIAENRDVVLIEKDPEVAKNVANHLDCIVINHEGNNPKVLKKAGIEDADFFISVTNSDEVNMVSCAIVSSEFNVPFKIARIRNLDYNTVKNFERDFLGYRRFPLIPTPASIPVTAGKNAVKAAQNPPRARAPASVPEKFGRD